MEYVQRAAVVELRDSCVIVVYVACQWNSHFEGGHFASAGSRVCISHVIFRQGRTSHKTKRPRSNTSVGIAPPKRTSRLRVRGRRSFTRLIQLPLLSLSQLTRRLKPRLGGLFPLMENFNLPARMPTCSYSMRANISPKTISSSGSPFVEFYVNLIGGQARQEV
jgi:hypothetical protein